MNVSRNTQAADKIFLRNVNIYNVPFLYDGVWWIYVKKFDKNETTVCKKIKKQKPKTGKYSIWQVNNYRIQLSFCTDLILLNRILSR